MKIYADIGTYLRDEPLRSFELPLNGNNHPILVLEKKNNETLSEIPNFLIPLKDRTYEIAFPLVTLADWDAQKLLISKVFLTFHRDNKAISLSLYLQDQVLDATQINDEDTKHRLTQELSDQCDRHTADTIAVLVGLFYGMRSQERAKKVAFPLLKLPSCLKKLSSDEARQPLVVSLERRYQLRHKLEMMTAKLRSQLNRTSAMIPLARIQEMDAYCLRDYVRRPGRNAIEKAGGRQELLGIQRFQNFNTPENRFLKGFCELLHLECQQYSYHHEATLLGSTIDYFRQDSTVQTIQKSISLLDKPNYVLQENPIYRSFYQAYLDFVHRRSDKEKLWGCRQRLAADALAVLLTASLLNLQGSYADALAALVLLDTPRYGRYLDCDFLPVIQCFLRTDVFSFQLHKPAQANQGDWLLSIKKQNFNSLEIKIWQLPVWVFWYCPKIETLEIICEKNTFCFYLYELPGQTQLSKSTTKINSTQVFQLPDILKSGWQDIVEFLTDKMQIYMEGFL